MIPRPSTVIDNLHEYVPASQDAWRLQRSIGDLLKFDWNESPEAHQIVKDGLIALLDRRGAINWYPDVSALELTQSIARFLNVSPSRVLAFPGSDAALETVARTYLSNGDTIAAAYPGYDNFRVYAESCGARVMRVNGCPQNFCFSYEEFLHRLTAVGTPRLIYLISPNNPLGYIFSMAQVTEILRRFPEAVVIVDEAFVEFAGAGASFVPLIDAFDNLFIIRSFSKAFGIAGLRLGYIVSNEQNLSNVRKLRNGKNVSMFAQTAGRILIENFHVIEQHVAAINEGKRYFIEHFREMGGVIHGSNGNFALIEAPDVDETILNLKAAKIYVRDMRRTAELPNCYRITFGYREHMDRVLTAFMNMPSRCWRVCGSTR